MKIITSPNCVKVEIKTFGIADRRRPNGKKPLYRRIQKITPTAYLLIHQQTIVCHPSLLVKLKAAIAKKNRELSNRIQSNLDIQIRNDFYYGVDQASKPDKTAAATVANGVFQPRVLNNPYFNPTST